MKLIIVLLAVAIAGQAADKFVLTKRSFCAATKADAISVRVANTPSKISEVIFNPRIYSLPIGTDVTILERATPRLIFTIPVPAKISSNEEIANVAKWIRGCWMLSEDLTSKAEKVAAAH